MLLDDPDSLILMASCSALDLRQTWYLLMEFLAVQPLLCLVLKLGISLPRNSKRKDFKLKVECQSGNLILRLP